MKSYICRLKFRIPTAAPVPRVVHAIAPAAIRATRAPRWRLPRISWKAPILWLLAVLALTLVFGVPRAASAVELYSDPCCGQVHYPVWVEPDPVYVTVPVLTPPQVVVVQQVVQDPVVVQVDDGDSAKKHRSSGKWWIEAGGGAGMWIIPGLKEDVHLGYQADLQLALRGFYIGLGFTWVQGLAWEKKTDAEPCVEKGNLALIALNLGYKFNKDGRVHPVLAAKFDTLVLDREHAGSALAFGVGASAGLSVDFPLSYGAITAGVEVGGHRHIWSQNDFYPPRSSVSVMGTIGYKF